MADSLTFMMGIFEAVQQEIHLAKKIGERLGLNAGKRLTL